MKRINRRITASADVWEDELVMPVQTVVAMLRDIPELAGVTITSAQPNADTAVIYIGDSEYKFMSIL